MDKEFFLIRHAESMGNIGMDGSYDPGLSPLGHAQAKHCGKEMLRFCDSDTLILSSPFERCLLTAEAIAEESDLTIKIMALLHEHFAEEWFPIRKVKFESLSEKAAKHELVIGEYDDNRWWPEVNEDLKDVKVRMAMVRNVLTGREYNNSKIVCVGHWASIKPLAELMVPDIDFPYVENAGVTKINYISGKFQEEFVNGLCLQD